MKIALLFLVALLSGAQESGPTPADQLLTRLAIESAGDAETPGIEIKIEGGRQFAIYDRFRLVALAAREAFRAGHPMDPAASPKALLEPRMIVLAFARMPMSGDPVQPQFVQINGRSGKRLKAEEIRTWLPGVIVPGDAVVVSFAIASLKPSDRITIVRVRFARALDGPVELQAAAAEAVGKWLYKPATMFHVPIPLVMKATVTFTRP